MLKRSEHIFILPKILKKKKSRVQLRGLELNLCAVSDPVGGFFGLPVWFGGFFSL